MNNITQYILYRKLDRRTYPKLYLNQTYYCEKILTHTIKNKRLIESKIRVWIDDKFGGFYPMYEPIFKTHFMTVKEYRKQKLLKINNTI